METGPSCPLANTDTLAEPPVTRSIPLLRLRLLESVTSGFDGLSMVKSGDNLPWLENEVFLELSESHSPSPESTRVNSFSSLDFPDSSLSSGISSKHDKSRDLRHDPLSRHRSSAVARCSVSILCLQHAGLFRTALAQSS